MKPGFSGCLFASRQLLATGMMAAAMWLASTTAGWADNPSSLPLITMDDFQFEGAFRLPDDTFGDSNMNYSQGPLAYNPVNHSIFIVGHAHHQAIAEFAVPELVHSGNIADLKMASPPVQNFVSVLDRVSGGNPQNLDRIGGLAWIMGPNGPELLVNAYEYYDAPGDNSQTTLVIRDPANLSVSAVDGYFTFSGGAGHTSGWISPVPAAWQPVLGGTGITGQSSGLPIISRLSVGPSAFVFDPLSIVGQATVVDPVPTVKLLDFPLSDPLHADLSNTSLTNDLWTHLSRAVYGFILPGTRTYVTIGHSGGHASGVCYKCTQSNGNLCGGYCAPDPEDYYHFYWLWDLNDLTEVKAGRLATWDVRPYDHGIFSTPFPTHRLGGGSFDPASGRLFVNILEADRLQGTYSNPPVVAVYRFSTDPEVSLQGFAADFGKTDCAACPGDLDMDNDVDGRDLSLLADDNHS
ncbi:MAG: hypothetical protein ACOZF0_02975 [Thermodesulfobacteriota bacterium]